MGLFKTSGVVYLLLGLALWVALLSIYILKTVGHYRNLTKGVTGQNLKDVLEKVLHLQNQNAAQITELAKELVRERNKSQNYFQKTALIRFNPFEDAGGDQSFVIALLNGENSGFVISSLHARGSTRIYAKAVMNAKPQTHKFSKEEKEAVEKAARHAPESVHDQK